MFIFRFLHNFFHNLYVATFKWYTLLLIRKATKAAAKLMVMSGKDPNHVSPTPAPYIPPTFDDDAINRAWMVDYKNRSNVWLVVDGYYVHHPKSHPILNSRARWEEKLKRAEEKLVAAKAVTMQESVEQANTAPTLKDILVEADKSRWVETQKPVVTVAENPVIDPEKKV
jgi:hypothetical protein